VKYNTVFTVFALGALATFAYLMTHGHPVLAFVPLVLLACLSGGKGGAC
jgi:hypothetical protein